MQQAEIIYPPIDYWFLQDDQEEEQAWPTIQQFADTWNANHKSRFTQPQENEFSVVLPGGINDPELALLDEALLPLKEAGIVYERAYVDDRKSSEFANAPWVQLNADRYPPNTYENLKEVFEQPAPCEHCGAPQDTGALTGTPLVVDESVLDKGVEGKPQYDPPGLDLMKLPNGAYLISSKVAGLLSASKVSGYELIDVISKQTKQPSQRLFLLKTKKVILDACDIHTPRDPGAICPVCGNVKPGLLGYYHVREEWLHGDELFSRNPSHLSDLCVSNRLFNILKAAGCKRMLASNGLFSCRHTK